VDSALNPNPNSQSQSAILNPAISRARAPDSPGRLAARQADRRFGLGHAADRRARAVAREGNARRTELLESLAQALTAFTTAHFGRDGTLDDGALDQALATAKRVPRRMKIEQMWFMKRLAARRAGTKLDSRAWSR